MSDDAGGRPFALAGASVLATTDQAAGVGDVPGIAGTGPPRKGRVDLVEDLVDDLDADVGKQIGRTASTVWTLCRRSGSRAVWQVAQSRRRSGRSHPCLVGRAMLSLASSHPDQPAPGDLVQAQCLGLFRGLRCCCVEPAAARPSGPMLRDPCWRCRISGGLGMWWGTSTAMFVLDGHVGEDLRDGRRYCCCRSRQGRVS